MSSTPIEVVRGYVASKAESVENDSVVSAEINSSGDLNVKTKGAPGQEGITISLGRVRSDTVDTPTPSIVRIGNISEGIRDHVVMDWNPRSNSVSNPEISLGHLTSVANIFSNAEDVSWSPEGRFLAVAGDLEDYPASLIILSRANIDRSGFSINSSISSAAEYRRVAWAPYDGYVALGGPGTGTRLELRKFNYSTGSFFSGSFSPGGPVSDVTDLKWSPSGNQLAVCHADHRVYITRRSNLGTTFSNEVQIDSTVTNPLDGDVSWSPCERFLAVPSTLGIRVFNLEGFPTDHSHATIPNSSMGGPGLSTSWSPDGRFLAATARISSTSMRIRVWRRSGLTFKTVFDSTAEANSSGRIAWHPDGQAWVVLQSDSSSNATSVRRVLGDDVSESIASLTTSGVVLAKDVEYSPDGSVLAIAHSNGLKLYSSMRRPVQTDIYASTPVP